MRPPVLAAEEHTPCLTVTHSTFSPHTAPILLLKKTKVFLSNADEPVKQLTLHLPLQKTTEQNRRHIHILIKHGPSHRHPSTEASFIHLSYGWRVCKQMRTTTLSTQTGVLDLVHTFTHSPCWGWEHSHRIWLRWYSWQYLAFLWCF